ncbi:hypothetical protein [Phenylobacterium sp.]|uniref:hypothetical protein n=1 Tax=Phenylobacterium sp. TaxID=1871053 RepID=UPI002F95B2C0
MIWGSLEPELTVTAPNGSRPRLLPLLDRENPNYVGKAGTLPLALEMVGAAPVFANPGANELRVMEALFRALYAPRAKASRLGDALVLVNPDLAALQNLRGFTNKPQPPSYHRIFEQFAALGGAPGSGSAARAYLGAYAGQAAIREGATGLLESGLSKFCSEAFEAFGLGSPWPQLSPSGLPLEGSPMPLAGYLAETPFAWFWSKWSTLHGPAGWRDKLPARRFADWQASIARTALAMGYLYEARVFLLMKEAVAALAAGGAPADAAGTIDYYLGAHPRPVPLGRIYGSGTPISTKACGPWIEGVVRQGVAFRAAAREAKLHEADWDDGRPPGAVFADWLGSLTAPAAQALLEDSQPSPSDGKNLHEFIRHLLRPLEDRSDETGFGDRADLYGLLRTSTAGTWFEPGPEWLVPVTSLLARRPGGDTTLNLVRQDLARLGLDCERDVLVGLLEASGLTTDSPDADDGLVVRSGF